MVETKLRIVVVGRGESEDAVPVTVERSPNGDQVFVTLTLPGMFGAFGPIPLRVPAADARTFGCMLLDAGGETADTRETCIRGQIPGSVEDQDLG